jgi:hypothetical protein
VVTTTDWISALSALVVAAFTIALFVIARRQAADTKILQRAYLSVEPQGIDRSGLSIETFVLIGQVAFKNVGKLPATEFVGVVKKIEVHDAEWVTPELIDADLPTGRGAFTGAFAEAFQRYDWHVVFLTILAGVYIAGVIPIGAEVPRGSKAINLDEVNQAQVSGDKYLYVWGRAKFKDGFGRKRHVNFCHRYPWAMSSPIIPGSGVAIPKQYGRYHQYGNKSD